MTVPKLLAQTFYELQKKNWWHYLALFTFASVEMRVSLKKKKLIAFYIMALDCHYLRTASIAPLREFRNYILLRADRVVQGLSTGFDIFWRPRRPSENNFQVIMKISVCFWGLGFWVSSTNFQKNNKGWPQQPPTERVPNISEKLDFWGSNPQQGTCVSHFGGKDDQTISIRKFFEKKGL